MYIRMYKIILNVACKVKMPRKEECGDIRVNLCIRISDNSKRGRCKNKLTEIDLNNKENRI